jgi:tRNA pseudouridine38-40 synthase
VPTRFRLDLWYCGTHFSGSQSQPNTRTVCGELKKALEKVCNEQIRLAASGRTDAGVHAAHQVVSFDTDSKLSPEQFGRAINSLLPDDIGVNHVTQVAPSFHALRSAKTRTYRYLWATEVAPFTANQFIVSNQIPFQIKGMDEIREKILGEHDFTHFRCTGSQEVSPRKVILDFHCHEKEVKHYFTNSVVKVVEFQIEANSFLYKMVRNIVGSLMEVFRGKQSVQDFVAMIDGPEKTFQYTPAPAKGLCLVKVKY